MSERDIEHGLRRWYREEVGEHTPAPQALRARVVAIPDSTPRAGQFAGNGPLVLIAAVALLSTLLLAFAIAAGSGLLRLPTAVVEPSPSAAVRATPMVSPSPASPFALTVEDEPIHDCENTMQEGAVLAFDVAGSRGVPGWLLTVHEDGLVTTGTMWGNDYIVPSSAPPDDGWQRRLTGAGVEILLDIVADASLPNCQMIYTVEGERTELRALLPGGVRAVWTGDIRLRVPTSAETRSTALLVDRLTDLESWLPRDLWAEDESRPYQQPPFSRDPSRTRYPLPVDALPDLDPCRFVPPEIYPLLDMKRYSPAPSNHWANCWFDAGPGDLGIHGRIRPTTSEQAASYAQSLFGETDLTSETIAGRTVYFNGCSEPPALACHAAIAISAEPYLIVFETNWHPSRDEWRTLAGAVLGEIAATDPSR